MAKTEAILFDVYKTLLDNETNEKRQDSYDFLSRWLSYHGVAITPPDLRDLYLDLCRKEIGKSSEPFPDIEIGVVFTEIIAQRGGPVPPPSALVSELALLFRITTTDRLSPLPGTIEMLRALQGKVKLGIASNAQRRFTIPELGKFAMTGFFDATVFSSDVGVCKPHPALFKAALGALSAKPETTVFVGDNLEADIQGAQSVGMRAVWINRGQESSDTIKPEFEAADQAELTEMLLAML